MYSGNRINQRVNTVHVPKLCKYLEYLCYILLLCFVIPVRIKNPNRDEELFVSYLRNFNKSYGDEVTYQRKLLAFSISLRNIETLNRNGTAHYGLTKYSDLLPEEFIESRLSPKISAYVEHNFKLSQRSTVRRTRRSSKIKTRISIPQRIDWREKKAVSRIKNQESCGACWAFAAIGVIESMYAIKNDKLVTFSTQEMIDCSKYDDGCDGGDIYTLLRWMKADNVTVVREEEYPLQLSKGACKNELTEGIHIKDFDCSSYIDSEDLILALLALNGPVAVAINAQSWQNYVGGTIQFHCSDDPMSINHAVQIVGYDLTVPVPYYIVKNSWGKDFGMDGYLQVAIGQNICGLAYEVCAIQIA